MRRGLPPAPGSRAPDGDGERGVALVIVLLFAALLSGLTAVALRGSMSGARAASVFMDEVRADELGRAAADAVAYQIVSGGPSAQRGGAFAIHLGQADVDIDYRSESARVDVNMAPVDLIAAVLTAAGADPAVVTSVRARVASERAGDQPQAASTASPIGTTNSPSGPAATMLRPIERAAPLENPGQAFGLWDLPADVAARALPSFTVANGTSRVDPVLADRLVLAALLGGEERVDDYIAQRSAGFVDTSSALALLPVTAKGFAGFSDVSAVRALVRVTVAHRFKRRYEIVLDPPAFAGQGPKVLSWRPLF